MVSEPLGREKGTQASEDAGFSYIHRMMDQLGTVNGSDSINAG